MKLHKTFLKKNIKKLHFFDWFLLIGIIVIIVFFLYLRVARKTEFTKVRILFSTNDWWWEGSPPPFWLVDEIQPGDKAYDSFGNEVARISEVNVIDIGGPYRNAQVVIDLAVTYDTKTKTYSYNFQPLQVGKPIDLSFEKGSVKGLVMKIGDEEVLYISKKIKVKMIEVLPEVAEKYEVGMKAYDSSGEVLVTIDEVMVRDYQYYEFSSSLNKNIQVIDPDFRDVELALTVKAFKTNQTYYYLNNAALKIGNEIWFEFPEVVIESSVIIDLY